MPKELIPTEKLYYKNMLLSKCDASVIGVRDNFIVTDKTVAFPEGGGQESDRGTLDFEGLSIDFVDVKKRYGTPIFLDDFPTINAGTQICHYISNEDIEKLRHISIGDKLTIRIDVARREKLSISHTASHLLYLGIGSVRPESFNRVIGCHIKEDGARFDFSVDKKFSPDEIKEITAYANKMIKDNLQISLYPHPENKDAWYWECNKKVIPCGGTHLESTRNIVNISVRRKNIGKGKDRIMCTFPDAILNCNRYIL